LKELVEKKSGKTTAATKNVKLGGGKVRGFRLRVTSLAKEIAQRRGETGFRVAGRVSLP